MHVGKEIDEEKEIEGREGRSGKKRQESRENCEQRARSAQVALTSGDASTGLAKSSE